jgi:hypothetical protein
MTYDFEQVRMHTTVVEMRAFASGEKYEAKVTNVYGYDGNEIPLPNGHYVWGFAWGKSYQEAKENAENSAVNLLKNHGVKVGGVR